MYNIYNYYRYAAADAACGPGGRRRPSAPRGPPSSRAGPLCTPRSPMILCCIVLYWFV